MRKILITGATGFLGSYLVKNFLSRGFEVIILKRSESNIWRIEEELKVCKAFNINEKPIEEIFSESKPELVIHTICNYGRKGSDLSELIDTNILLGCKILEQAVRVGVKVFINTDTLLPRSINDYSLSKGQVATWLKSRSHVIDVINFRIEHMYGPLDDSNKFINWLVSKMIDSNESLINLTSGIQKRDFIFIDDVVDAFNLVIKHRDKLSGWNELDLATQKFTSVKAFILKIAEQLYDLKGLDVVSKLNFGAVAYREAEIMEPVLNNSTLADLGWVPKYSLDEGIQKTLKNYK